MRNGYTSLTDSDEIPDNVTCPLPAMSTDIQIEPCYVKSNPNNGPSFMIGSKTAELEGMVYQYNEDTLVFDFDAQTGEDNQLWRWSGSVSSIIHTIFNIGFEDIFE